MIAHIVSIGDEVLLGDIVDTNASFLCTKLKEMGIEVQKIIAIGDDVDAIVSNLDDISFRADICLVTGGLGPTQDDLTCFACNKAADDTLVLKEDAFESMKVYFMQKGLQLTKAHEKQAKLPSSSKTLINNNGTAAGFYITINRCLFFFMPGVPSEMKMMFEKEVVEVLINRFNLSDTILIERLTVFGLPESKVGALLKNFEKNFPRMRLGLRVDFPMIEVKIILYHSLHDEKKCRSDMNKAKHWVIERLKENIVSREGLSMVQEVWRLLAQQKKTLAVAEGCTGGLISNLMTDVAGSSEIFKSGTITCSDSAKINALDVQKKTILEYGAVSEETVLEMAQSVRLKAETDFGISTSGIAGPAGGTKEKPVGTVCIGLAGPLVAIARTYRFAFDDRLMNKKMFAMTALELLRNHLVLSVKTVPKK